MPPVMQEVKKLAINTEYSRRFSPSEQIPRNEPFGAPEKGRMLKPHVFAEKMR